MPPRIGNPKSKTMLYSIYSSEGPTIIFLYGIRNVGKSTVLKKLREDFGGIYLDLEAEEFDFKKLVDLLDDRVFLLDEISRLEVEARGEHKILSELDKNALERVLENLIKAIIERKSRVIFTASYGLDVEVVLKKLRRRYAKDLKHPKSERGYNQPYRVIALPRPFLSFYSYLSGKDIPWARRVPFAFIKHITPKEYIDGLFNYSYITPEKYAIDRFKKLGVEDDRFIYTYLAFGGLPNSMKIAKKMIVEEEEKIVEKAQKYTDDIEYIAEEIANSYGSKSDSKLASYLLGQGDKIFKREEILPLAKAFLVLPVSADYSREQLLAGVPYTMISYNEAYPVPLGPRAAQGAIYYLRGRPVAIKSTQRLGMLYEAAVLLHLVYLQAYSYPKFRNSTRPPIFRPKPKKNIGNVDFILPIKADESDAGDIIVPMIVEVKHTLPEGDELEKLIIKLGHIGYLFGTYPIIVTKYKGIVKRIPVTIEKDVLRRIHKDYEKIYKENARRYYGITTYKPSTRYVNIMDIKYFLASVPPRFPEIKLK